MLTVEVPTPGIVDLDLLKSEIANHLLIEVTPEIKRAGPSLTVNFATKSRPGGRKIHTPAVSEVVAAHRPPVAELAEKAAQVAGGRGSFTKSELDRIVAALFVSLSQ